MSNSHQMFHPIQILTCWRSSLCKLTLHLFFRFCRSTSTKIFLLLLCLNQVHLSWTLQTTYMSYFEMNSFPRHHQSSLPILQLCCLNRKVIRCPVASVYSLQLLTYYLLKSWWKQTEYGTRKISFLFIYSVYLSYFHYIKGTELLISHIEFSVIIKTREVIIYA